MPSEHSAPPPAQDIPPALLQTKTCLSCHRPLVTSSTTHDDDDEDIQALLLLSTLDSPSHSLCPFCRLRPTRSSSSSSSSSTPPPHSSTPHQFLYRPSPPEPVIQHRQALHHPDHVYPSGPSSPPLPSSFIPSRPVPIPARASPASSALSLDTASLSLRPHLTATLSSPYDNTPSPTLSTASSSSAVPHPDPAFDISTVRARPQPHYCLYPGSKFTGTQKSGRNSYDVTVDIVSVDFASSHLAGYLCIRGLTDDWPELTTYFDAEIVGGGGSGNGGSGGGRYGFATRKWGATEEDDMMHWARFPAFRHAKNKRLTSPTSPVIPSPSSPPPSSSPILGPAAANTHEASAVDPLGGGAVFMRWKERFLVPDHRVQDISGASFAGFYYVCVDVGSSSGEATMGGFYFHQHSEPYQQLSLRHVPEKASASFELR